MDTKKMVSVLAVVFVIFFVIQSPTDAANIVHSIGHGLDHVANQLSEFIKKLLSPGRIDAKVGVTCRPR